MKTFMIADTHFGDKNIMDFEQRPFKTVEEMNETIIKYWNNTVSPEDTVYLIGDVGDVSIVKHLNGHKFLIKGNHDTKSNNFYRMNGFEEVYDKPIIIDNFYILSHEPIYVNETMPYANIFGHVHKNPIYKTVSKRGYCVSLERINYTPKNFYEIKKEIIELNN